MTTQNLFQLGYSRLSAPREAAERSAIAESQVQDALAQAAAVIPCRELVLLSTCSRLELYGVSSDPEGSLRAAKKWLISRGGPELEPALAGRTGMLALSHLFRVASGLDSWIIGESEILGQVKRAYETARKAGFTSSVLNRAMQSATAAGKAARAKTGIQNGVHSIGGAAALLARSIFGPEGDGDVLVIGAGEAAEASVRHLAAKNFRRVFVANRTAAKALELASKVGGLGLPLERGMELLSSVEIAIFSTACPEPIVKAEALKKLLPLRKKPLFLVDLGMPRNVEAACARLPEVFVYGLTELKDVVARSMAAKAGETTKAEAIVADAAAACAAELEKAALRSARVEVTA